MKLWVTRGAAAALCAAAVLVGCGGDDEGGGGPEPDGGVSAGEWLRGALVEAAEVA